jgi:selenocysteine-specific elongation factor
VPEERKAIVVGTAGHIDHGKTALVKALTGVDTDRLDEEKRRGITIDLGFAPLDLEGGIHIGFVDVPGHERFVKNMLAGAGGIDAVLIVVAADESVMPQTREHVEICDLLGIETAAVAVTKADLVDEETVELVTLEVAELLDRTRFAGCPMVAVSSVSGKGLDQLRALLASMAEKVSAKSGSLIPRLPVDRVFTMKGFGTVVTGTLISGSLINGQAVELQPSGRRSQIKGLQVHEQAVELASAGHRVAVNLAGVAKSDVQRGEQVTLPGAIKPSRLLDLHCRLLTSSPCNLVHSQRVRFHLGASELIGRVQVLSGKNIEPGGEGLVRIRLEAPTAACVGDHYVIRRYSPMITIGGGVVLDNLPGIVRDRQAAVLYLENIRAADLRGRCRLFVVNNQKQSTAVDLTGRFGLLPEHSENMLRELVDTGEAVKLSDSPFSAIGREVFGKSVEKVMDALEAAHKRSPFAEGIQAEGLKTALGRRADDTVFRATLEQLQQEGKIRLKDGLAALSGHRVDLSGEQQGRMEAMAGEVRSAGFAPPFASEVIAAHNQAGDARKLFDLLVSRGELVKVAEGFYFHREAIEKLIEETRYKAPESGFSVPEFKDWFGISRKFAIPLLEYLDSKRVTYREGDLRRLSKFS